MVSSSLSCQFCFLHLILIVFCSGVPVPIQELCQQQHSQDTCTVSTYLALQHGLRASSYKVEENVSVHSGSYSKNPLVWKFICNGSVLLTALVMQCLLRLIVCTSLVYRSEHPCEHTHEHSCTHEYTWEYVFVYRHTCEYVHIHT